MDAPMIDFGRLHRRWGWVVAGALVGGAAVFGATFLMTPVYRATVTMASAESLNSTTPLSGAFQMLGGAGLLGLGTQDTQMEVAMALLTSRRIVDEFIAENDLAGVLLPDEDDPGVSEAYRRFTDDIMTADLERRTGIATVTVDWHDPTVAAAWANALVSRVNDVMRRDALRESEQMLEDLSRQIRESRVIALREGITEAVLDISRRLSIVRTREQYALKVIDPAKPTDVPIKPARSLLTFVGAVLGAMAGAFWALFGKGRGFTLQTPEGSPASRGGELKPELADG